MGKQGKHRMRICKLPVVLLILTIFVTGCGAGAPPRMEEYTWAMETVRSEAEEGRIVAYGGAYDGSGETGGAEQVELICTAEDGVLTLTDRTRERVYSGAYTLRQSDPGSRLYDVTLDGEEGYAVAAMTTYHDGREEPTLVMHCGIYTIYFYTE